MFSHFKSADLRRRPEPVLERSEDPEILIALTDEIENTVHEMLHSLRPREFPGLRDMRHYEDRDVLHLAQPHELIAALPDL